MENEQVAQIPYFAHEGEMVRMERANKRLWIVILVLIICLMGSNIGWLVYESQFTDEIVSTEIDAEQDGEYNFVSGGDINYGTESTRKTDGETPCPENGR